jgi:hypothetical protein
MKQHSEQIVNILKAILVKIGNERVRKDNSATRYQILTHRIFQAVNEIERGIDRMSFP